MYFFDNIYQQLSAALKKCVDIARERGASSWLSAMPIQKHGFINKANSTRGFLQRNLRQCSINVKSLAYVTYVRPIVEYASVVWSCHHINGPGISGPGGPFMPGHNWSG